MIKINKLSKINHFWNIEDFYDLSLDEQKLLFSRINKYLESRKAEDRIIWAIKYLPKQLILSSSFGIQSVVSLHLVTRYFPRIPIVLIDTGYLFPETYRFIDQLKEKMQLNLYVFRSNESSAWQEARHGELWKQGIEGINQYNLINKIKPMHCALKALKVKTWFAGLRRNQSSSRKNLPVMMIQKKVFKFLPIIDWDDNQVFSYIKQYNLDNHPLWGKGYVSVGDIHTTRKKKHGMRDEDTRFFGLQRECGLNVSD